MANQHDRESIKAGRMAAGRAESATSTAGDPALRTLQKSLGNDGLRDQIAQGRADRATMLAHLCDRLGVMRELQNRELGLLTKGPTYDWWRTLSGNVSGELTVPDPMRWHTAAQEYKDAAAALCAGDIGRGRYLLEHAMQAEDRAIDAMSQIVDAHGIAEDVRPDPAALDGLMAMGQVEPCPPPGGVSVADDILRVEVDLPHIAEIRRTRDPWWADEEEEEEEQDGKPEGDDAGGG